MPAQHTAALLVFDLAEALAECTLALSFCTMQLQHPYSSMCRFHSTSTAVSQGNTQKMQHSRKYGFLQMLYFCEYDLMFFKERQQMLQHLKRSRIQHPPGDEIYRNANVSMFEIDGKKEKLFCQNLCYLAKLFLDHKTLFYDVDLFLFYVLCECDERGAHIVG